MCELNFITIKNHKRTRTSSGHAWDIKVSLSSTKNYGAHFTLTADAVEKICPDTKRIVYAISGSRIYFKSSDVDGWKLQENTHPNAKIRNCYWQLPRSHKEATIWATDNNGEYELLFDEKQGLYCIDANGAAS